MEQLSLDLFNFLDTYESIYRPTFMVAYVLFFCGLGYCAFHELKKQNIDLLKVAQYISLATHLLSFSIILLIYLTNDGYSNFLYLVSNTSLYMFMYLYIYQWAMMIHHMQEIKSISRGNEFSAIRNKINKTEAISAIVFILIWFVYFVYNLFTFSVYYQSFGYYFKLVVSIIIAAFFIVAISTTYFVLTNKLNESLSLYYRENQSKMRWVMLVNILYMILIIVGDILQFAEIPRFFFDEKEWQSIVYITYLISLHVSQLLMVTINIIFGLRHLNFESYIKDLYEELKIGQPHISGSMFIQKSP